MTFSTRETATRSGALAGLRTKGERHSVFVADDQEEVLRTIAEVLEKEFQIVGLAGNGRDVLKLVPLLCPEVVVLDIVMPKINGVEAALRLGIAGSQARIVFVTVDDDPDFLEAALSAGGRAYVSKPHLGTDLVPAIKDVLAGRAFISPSISLAAASLHGQGGQLGTLNKGIPANNCHK